MNMMMKRLMILLAILLAATLSFPAFAADTVSYAEVIRTAGPVTLTRAPSTKVIAAKPGLKLFAGDVLKVDKGGKAQLKFQPDTLVLLKENSVLTLNELAPSGRTRNTLSAGSLIANLKEALSPGASFELQTPTALAIVRGTVYEVEITPSADESKPPAVDFYGYEGDVEIDSNGEVFHLTAGARLLFEYGVLPQVLAHTRVLADVMQMFSEDYWKNEAKNRAEGEIRHHLPF
jgi:hypothetical protein